MTAIEKALRLLSTRAYSEKELQRKLFMSKFSSAEINEAISYCKDNNYINDEYMAELYANELAEKYCGINKIRFQLQKKGFNQAIISEIISNLEDSEINRAEHALEQKMRTLSSETNPQKLKEKCFRFLLSKGFSPNIIFSVIQ